MQRLFPSIKTKIRKYFFQEFVASTEIVHCKSTNEIGVNESCGKCFTLWTKKILSRFNGKYIVLVGKFACDRALEIKGIIKDKIVIKTEHPNSRINGNTDKVRQESFIKQIESQT